MQAAPVSPEGMAWASDLNSFARAGVDFLTFDTAES